ncbi:MAG: flagellar FlbD family protein [Clostridia bacterium]|nr:flagellar FlbD family protein [Clostridia bacterium]
MILVTTINGEEMYLNEDLIETMRVTPDTVLFLTNGKRVVVKNSPDDVLNRIKAFRRDVFQGALFIEKK